jgi:energy-coupling factor transporter ATP-binding protein EcfA2
VEDFYERIGSSAGFGDIMQAGRSPMTRIDDAEHLSKARLWSVHDDIYWGTSETCEMLPGGVYVCAYSQENGANVIRQKICTDDLLDLPDEASAELITEFEKFWQREPDFRSRGFLLKRGFLLWGPPASGKTTTVNLFSRKLIENYNGVILLIDHPQTFSPVLKLLRKIEPRRRIVVVMEDIDAMVARWGESEFLALLDGETQTDSIVFVATTNYPERLDRRFVDRPSRFDTIRYIGMPSEAARRVYLTTKEPSLSQDELEGWLRASDGFSIAHLKEMIIAVKCLGQPLHEVVARLEAMQQRQPSSNDIPRQFQTGFNPGRQTSTPRPMAT